MMSRQLDTHPSPFHYYCSWRDTWCEEKKHRLQKFMKVSHVGHCRSPQPLEIPFDWLLLCTWSKGVFDSQGIPVSSVQFTLRSTQLVNRQHQLIESRYATTTTVIAPVRHEFAFSKPPPKILSVLTYLGDVDTHYSVCSTGRTSHSHR